MSGTPDGVVSVAIDPGAVFSNLWLRDAFFSKPSAQFLLRALYAPPADGATAVVLACLVPFPRRRVTRSAACVSARRTRVSSLTYAKRTPQARNSAAEAAAALAGAYFPRDENDVNDALVRPRTTTNEERDVSYASSSRFRFYARGLFATSLVSRWGPGDRRDARSRLEKATRFARLSRRRDAGVLGAGLADEAFVLRDRRGAFLARVVQRRRAAALWEEAGGCRGARGSGYPTELERRCSVTGRSDGGFTCRILLIRA